MEPYIHDMPCCMIGIGGTVSHGQPLIHDATAVDIISLTSMAMLFIQQEWDLEAYDAAKCETHMQQHIHMTFNTFNIASRN